MVYRPNVNPKLVFVLMPFRPPFNSYYDQIIKPSVKSAGFEALRADEVYGTSPIIRDIWQQIWNANVVIADVTSKNPNVNYELGLCHALGVPTIIITQDLNDVPFDYKHRRCIWYDTQGAHWQRDLKKAISATLRQVTIGEDIPDELGWPYETSPYRTGEVDSTLIPAGEARDSVNRGARLVRDSVAFAFGPRGGSVFVTTTNGQHHLRHGFTIAQSVHSLDNLERIGIAHAQQVASEMRALVGDGTKAAVLIYQKLLELATVSVRSAYSVPEVLRGMDRATETAVAALRASARPLTPEALANVAATAACASPKAAKPVVEAYRKIGLDGVVVIERSNLIQTTLEIQEGMSFDRGYVDPALMLASETNEIVLEQPCLLIADLRVSSMKTLLPILEQVAEAKSPLLLIADDVEGEALATLVVNRTKGSLNCVAVKSPGYGDRRKAVLQDIAVLTGATVISPTIGMSLESATLDLLGHARKVIVTKDTTTIVGGQGEPNVAAHVKRIREDLARTTNPYDSDKLRERLAKLSGAIAVIRIGGISSQETMETAYPAESAMYSVGVASEEGYVVGGGISLLRAKNALAALSFRNLAERAGLNIVSRALEEPFRQLLKNNSANEDLLFKKTIRAKTPNVGFNVENGKIQDLEKAGVLDPVVTVVRSLQLAFAHAKTVLETGAWKPENPNANSAPPVNVDVTKSADK